MLRWVAWAREQVDAWPSVDDPDNWDAPAMLEALISECRAARGLMAG